MSYFLSSCRWCVGGAAAFCAAAGVVIGIGISGLFAAEPGTDGKTAAGTTIVGKDGAPMVLIPAGPFTMGTEDVGSNWFQGNPNEFPEHTVNLKGYYIDQFEVTIARYAKFLEETGHETPPSWDDEAVTNAGDRPVVGVDWEDANAY